MSATLETLSVAAIKNGTVIDHITAGQALHIIYLLSLNKSKSRITIGMQLPSKTMGTKDIIKVEDRVLSEDEANEIVVFAPTATINVIKDYEVIKKYTTHLPATMKSVFICPNPTCITQSEPIDTFFYISQQGKQIKLTCHYCEKPFDREQVKVKI
ncbi:MAG: aspartate carbamoyltransferase regulatory subunit [Gammaproteobacteria bacterium]